MDPARLWHGGIVEAVVPAVGGAIPILGARFADRIGKGIRGAPRDAMIADETPPGMRGARLRPAPIARHGRRVPRAAGGGRADGVVRGRHPSWCSGWRRSRPCYRSWWPGWRFAKAGRRPCAIAEDEAGGFRDIDPATRRLILVGFVFTLARFSEGFLILRALDIGVSATLSPLVLVAFNLAFGLFAYPAGALADRIGARRIVAGRDRRADRRRCVAGAGHRAWSGCRRLPAVGRAHGADPGPVRQADRRRRTGRAARDQLRRLLFRQRDRDLAGEPRRGADLGPRRGAAATFTHRRRIAAVAGAMLVLLPSGSRGTAASGPPPARD